MDKEYIKLRNVIDKVLDEHPNDFVENGVIKVVVEYRTCENVNGHELDLLAGYAMYCKDEEGFEELTPIDNDSYSFDDLVYKYEVRVIPEEDGDPAETYLAVWY